PTAPSFPALGRTHSLHLKQHSACSARIHRPLPAYCRKSRQLLHLVGPEPRPVVAIGDNHWSLLVTQRLYRFQSLRVGAEIDKIVIQAVLTQCPVGGIALHTIGLAIYGNLNFSVHWITLPYRSLIGYFQYI